MNTHTPGPWTQAMYSPTDIVANGEAMIATARDGFNGITRDQAAANARLIAAAPDLLQALADLVAATPETFDNRHEMAAARDAIARATTEDA